MSAAKNAVAGISVELNGALFPFPLTMTACALQCITHYYKWEDNAFLPYMHPDNSPP